MSTNSRHSTESQTTTPAQSTPADAASAEATPTEAPDPDDAESWVKRCQRQFDADRTDRLRNLADGENEAMPG